MLTIDDVIESILKNEGGYVNNKNDLGSETNWGITRATARSNGYTGPMRDMPKSAAFDIYRKQYVTAPGFDRVALVSMPIAAELVDTGVNMGPKVAATFLQRALTGLNNQGRDYADIVPDGAIGPATLTALRAYLARRGELGEKRLLALLNALQGERYLTLAESRVANEAFLYGWLGRVA